MRVLPGFTVSGTRLLDGNGNAFVVRGANHLHAWHTHQGRAFAHIAATGSNAVRVVLSDGQRWERSNAVDVANVISACKENKLICMLEVHDVTGSGEDEAAGTLEKTIEYWLDISNVLRGEEAYVLVNIANEPYGNGVPERVWIDSHVRCLEVIREAGLTHTLVVDAANWGQDCEEIMYQNASRVAAADSLGNTMFSVHMYEFYQDRSKIESYVSGFLADHNLPLMVGEFCAVHRDQKVDEDSILEVVKDYEVGCLGWSWSGNEVCNASMDMVVDFDPGTLSSWGERLINGVNGIRETSVLASVYAGSDAQTRTTSEPTSKHGIKPAPKP